MKIKYLSFALLFVLLALSQACNYKWEPLKSDYEPMLNVYGIISLDPEIAPFVMVTRTLTLEDSARSVIRRDTIFYSENDYWIFEVYRSNFLIMDADVRISDGSAEYQLFPVKLTSSSYWIDDSVYFDDSPEIPIGYDGSEFYVYMDTTGQFIPRPNTQYSLSVRAEGYPQLTGNAKTPELPQILNWESLPDTLRTGTGYTVRWKPINEGINGVIQYQTGDWGENVRRLITSEDSSFTFIPELRDDYNDPNDDNRENRIFLTLRFMDENYYQNFVKGQTDEVFSFVLGATNRELIYGVEGGIGIFSAFSQITLTKYLK